jgi:PEP-CTERM motif
MKLAIHGLIAAAGLVTLGVAQATPQTLEVDEAIRVPTSSSTFEAHDLSGSTKFTFSNLLVNAASSARVIFSEVGPSQVTAPYKPGTPYYQINGAVHVTSPVQAMVADFGADAFAVSSVQMSGGVNLITTIKNGASAGDGDLTISNMRVVMGDRTGFGGTIYADLSSTTAGFSNRTGYALWTFDQLVGTTTHAYPPLLGGGQAVDMSNSLHGLFLVNSAEGKALIQQALRLNVVGLSSLTSIENRGSTTNIDPLTGKVAGWGSMALNTSVVFSVPEPSTHALMLVGLLGVALVARRRARH